MDPTVLTCITQHLDDDDILALAETSTTCRDVLAPKLDDIWRSVRADAYDTYRKIEFVEQCVPIFAKASKQPERIVVPPSVSECIFGVRVDEYSEYRSDVLGAGAGNPETYDKVWIVQIDYNVSKDFRVIQDTVFEYTDEPIPEAVVVTIVWRGGILVSRPGLSSNLAATTRPTKGRYAAELAIVARARNDRRAAPIVSEAWSLDTDAAKDVVARWERFANRRYPRDPIV